MARPTTITDDQILAAARRLFLERGLAVTTAELARQAGVAEGTLFNRFRNKQQLFRAAMEHDIEKVPWLAKLGRAAGTADVRDTLVEVGGEMIDFFRMIMPAMLMAWSNREEAGLSELLASPDPPPLRALRFIAGYFEKEMRAHRIRRQDPEVVARCFLGSLQNYVFIELLLKAHDQTPLPAETYLRGIVNLLWNGLAPTEGAEPAAARPRPKPKKRR
jgi:AcrR family transcriptional regulator